MFAYPIPIMRRMPHSELDWKLITDYLKGKDILEMICKIYLKVKHIV